MKKATVSAASLNSGDCFVLDAGRKVIVLVSVCACDFACPCDCVCVRMLLVLVRKFVSVIF